MQWWWPLVCVSQASSAAYDDRSLSLPYTLPNLPWHEGSVGDDDGDDDDDDDDDGDDDDADSVGKDYLQKCVQWTWPGKAWPQLDYNLTVHRTYFILYQYRYIQELEPPTSGIYPDRELM